MPMTRRGFFFDAEDAHSQKDTPTTGKNNPFCKMSAIEAYTTTRPLAPIPWRDIGGAVQPSVRAGLQSAESPSTATLIHTALSLGACWALRPMDQVWAWPGVAATRRAPPSKPSKPARVRDDGYLVM